MSRGWILGLQGLGFLACVLFFVAFPRFDLWVSGLFFEGGFVWKDWWLMWGFYEGTRVVAGLLLLGLPVLILASWIPKLGGLVARRRKLVFLFCALLVGPGILVNAVLKDYWDRPRPRQVVEFDGGRAYEPPFAPAFNCDDCHSFVSGHASVGFFFFSVALLMRRRVWLWAPVLLGGAVGFARVVQGGHFLSDVVFSGWVVWFVCSGLYCLLDVGTSRSQDAKE